MRLTKWLGAQLRVAVFLLCMLFLILKAYMQRLWEMIAILFSIKPFFYEGSRVGWTLILNLFTNICAGKGEQCSGRACDAYTLCFSPLFRKMWKQGRARTMNKRCRRIPGAARCRAAVAEPRGDEKHAPRSPNAGGASAPRSTGGFGRTAMGKLRFGGW